MTDSARYVRMNGLRPSHHLRVLALGVRRVRQLILVRTPRCCRRGAGVTPRPRRQHPARPTGQRRTVRAVVWRALSLCYTCAHECRPRPHGCPATHARGCRRGGRRVARHRFPGDQQHPQRRPGTCTRWCGGRSARPATCPTGRPGRWSPADRHGRAGRLRLGRPTCDDPFMGRLLRRPVLRPGGRRPDERAARPPGCSSPCNSSATRSRRRPAGRRSAPGPGRRGRGASRMHPDDTLPGLLIEAGLAGVLFGRPAQPQPDQLRRRRQRRGCRARRRAPGRPGLPPDRDDHRPGSRAGQPATASPASGRRWPGTAAPTSRPRPATSPSTAASGRCDELLAGHPDIDGVFAANDLMAQGALAALREAGRRVPEDVAVVGFDDSERGDHGPAGADHGAAAAGGHGRRGGPDAAGPGRRPRPGGRVGDLRTRPGTPPVQLTRPQLTRPQRRPGANLDALNHGDSGVDLATVRADLARRRASGG